MKTNIHTSFDKDPALHYYYYKIPFIKNKIIKQYFFINCNSGRHNWFTKSCFKHQSFVFKLFSSSHSFLTCFSEGDCCIIFSADNSHIWRCCLMASCFFQFSRESSKIFPLSSMFLNSLVQVISEFSKNSFTLSVAFFPV